MWERKNLYDDNFMEEVVFELITEGLVKFFIGSESRENYFRLSYSMSKDKS